MPEPQTADVLNQDGPIVESQVSAEELAAVAEKAGEADPQAIADQGENEEQKQKRLGGWQRKILKLEQERDVWRDHALAQESKLKGKEPEIAPVVKEPQPPDFETFQGTTEEFKKALSEYPAKLREFLDKQRTEETQKQQSKQLQESFHKRLGELPELPKMKEAAAEAKVSNRLANFMGQVAAGMRNGTDVMKEAILDPETLSALVELDQVGDGDGIKAQLHAISAGLRIANKQAAAKQTEDKEPLSSRAPRPPIPVRNAPAKDVTSLEDLPYKDFVKRREAQQQGK